MFDACILWFSQNNSQIQTLAIIISALAALALIWHNGKIAKIRAMIDLITAQKLDKELVEASNLLYRLARENPGCLGSYVKDSEDEESRRIRSAILLVLNNQEFIAVGIRLKAFDEEVYKQLQYSNVMTIWRSTSSFIYAARDIYKKPTIFQDFENLAHRWEQKPIKILNKSQSR